MKRICCVCKKYLGEKEGPKDMITHGYCDSCLEIYMAEIEADFKELGKSDPASPKGYAGQEAYNKKDLSCVAKAVQDLSCVAGGEAG